MSRAPGSPSTSDAAIVSVRRRTGNSGCRSGSDSLADDQAHEFRSALVDPAGAVRLRVRHHSSSRKLPAGVRRGELVYLTSSARVEGWEVVETSRTSTRLPRLCATRSADSCDARSPMSTRRQFPTSRTSRSSSAHWRRWHIASNRSTAASLYSKRARTCRCWCAGWCIEDLRQSGSSTPSRPRRPEWSRGLPVGRC